MVSFDQAQVQPDARTAQIPRMKIHAASFFTSDSPSNFYAE